MTYFEDMTAYTYHGGYFGRPKTLNVGWLGKGHEFPKKSPSEELVEALWQYCTISVAQMRGLHVCEICNNRDSVVKRNDETLLLGSSEIRVFGLNGRVFAAPTLVFHYVTEHQYAPPEEFVGAAINGPKPPDEAYFARLKELELEWNPTSRMPGGLRFRSGRGPGHRK